MESQKRMRVSARHWDLLLNILEENPEMVTGKFVCQNAKQKSTTLWQDAAIKLNALGLGEKTPDKWKLALQDWKYKTKMKIAEIKDYERKTGGGPAIKIKLNEQEERLINIVGWTAAVGNENVPESGLGRISLMPEVLGPSTSQFSEAKDRRSKTLIAQELQLPVDILYTDKENVQLEESLVIVVEEEQQQQEQSTQSQSKKKQKTDNSFKRKNANGDDVLGSYQNETMEVLREISIGIGNLNIQLTSVAHSLAIIADKYNNSVEK